MWGERRSLIGLFPGLDISIAGVSSMPASCFVVYFLCPLSMCFESFLLFVLSHILLSREIHIQKVLEIRKHICPRSMKRDYPSLIFAKTQFLLHFRLFLLRSLLRGSLLLLPSVLEFFLCSTLRCDPSFHSCNILVVVSWSGYCRRPLRFR